LRQLADAGALADESTSVLQVKERGSESSASTANSASAPAASASGQSAPEPKPVRRINQKALLAVHLIAIGDLTHARMILDRLPLLSQMFGEIGENMCRLLQVIVNPVYQTVNPSKDFIRKPVPLKDFVPINTLSPKLCQIFEKPLVGRRVTPPRYKFFYDLWKDNLPVCNDFDSLLKVIRAVLPYIGPFLSRDPILVGKLCRIGAAHVGVSNKYLVYPDRVI
jgi:THO complex subunit 2